MPTDPSSMYQSVTSATQQTQNALSSAGNLTTSFSQSASALGAQAIQSVRDMAENLTSAGVTLWNSAVGGIDTLMSDSVGKLNQLKMPPVPTNTQPQNVIKGSYTPSVLQYPPDMPPYYMHFAFRAYERPTAVDIPKKATTANIFLPVPPNLIESFNMKLADVDIGNLYNIAQDAAGGSFDAVNQMLKGQSGAAKGAGLSVAGMLGDSAGGAASQVMGAAMNPHVGVVFNGVNLRAPHTFTYRLSPRNIEESKAIRSIIREFKLRMHPVQRKFTFDYPDIVDIKIVRPGEKEPMFVYKTCFLESMSVNYAPNGTPTFFAGSREPTDIEVSLQFKEIEIFSRSDFDGTAKVQEEKTDTGGR